MIFNKVLLSILFNVTMILYTGFFAALTWVLIGKGDHEVSVVFVMIYIATLTWFMVEENKYRQQHQ